MRVNRFGLLFLPRSRNKKRLNYVFSLLLGSWKKKEMFGWLYH